MIPHPKPKNFSVTLCSSDYNAHLPLKTLVFFPINASTPIPSSTKKSKKNNNNNNNKKQAKQIGKNKSKQNNKNEQTNEQSSKQKTSHQLWRQNLSLWTVALHMCDRRLTLSLTTINS